MVDRLETEYPDHYNRDSTSVFFAIRALAQTINDDANAWLAECGLNSATYNYLVNIYALGKDHALTQNEISLLVHTTHASVAQMVRVLEKDGLVKRKKNPLDGRSVVVTLTARGLRIIRKAIPLHHSAMERKIAHMSQRDRKKLMSLLLAVDNGLEADRAPTA